MTYNPDAEDSLNSRLAADSPWKFKRSFHPVIVRERHDGWTLAKQADFITALGESGCVTAACAAVGMSTKSAYALRARFDAFDFRQAWEAALDYAVARLEDAALSRALNGVPVPHYYKGEVVGEHRRYDERLTQFILRYRKPLTYAKCWDKAIIGSGHSEQEAERFAVGIDAVRTDASRHMWEQEVAEREAYEAAEAEATATRAARVAAEAAARAKETEADKQARFEREMDELRASLAAERRDASPAAERRVSPAAEWGAASPAAERRDASMPAYDVAAGAPEGEVPPDVALPSLPSGDGPIEVKALGGVTVAPTAAGEPVGPGNRLSRRAARRRTAREAPPRTPAAGRP